jgi:hypothetical protein
MEMNSGKPSSSKKSWLIGLGIGCGAVIVLIILLFIGGFYFVKNITRGFKDSEQITAALQAKYGKVEDFVPDPSGAIAPDRLEAFLKVRESTAPARKTLEGTLGELAKREKSLSAVRYGIGMVPQMAEYFRSRGQALMDSGMGMGEYEYIYVLAYFSWLKKSPEDGPGIRMSRDENGVRFGDREQESAEIQKDIALRRINRTVLPMLRNQLGKIPQPSATGPKSKTSFRDILAAEAEAMLTDAHRLPWQDGLPDMIKTSFEPFRDRLEAGYGRSTNLFELSFEFRTR